MPHRSLNPRVIAETNLRPVLDDVGRGRAAADLAARADLVAVALENVSDVQADGLAREARAAGADGALGVGRSAARTPEGGVVLVGPRPVLKAVLDHLAAAPDDLRAMGDEIRRALDAHARRHFEIRLGRRRLAVGPQVAVMGVVNVTPDSFSDGGQYFSAEAAIAHGRRLVRDGADLLDVGGESTRPGSDPVPEEEELARVLPVIRALAAETDVPLSIDTRRARVAREAVAAGASLVNDVTGLRGDCDMARTVADTGAGVVLMHMLGEPRTMQDDPRYDHLMADLCRALRRSIETALEAGVPEDAIVVDPGIGFGKTLEHNVEILARLSQLRTLGRPILVGPSRKRFIGQLTGIETPAERTYGTAAACALAVAAGALLVRVHDVREVRQALAVAGAIVRAGGDGKAP